MRALRIWTDIAEWRWTPAVGLALGALSYVSLALLVIPDQIGDDQRNASRSIGTFQSLRNRTSAFAASIAPSLQAHSVLSFCVQNYLLGPVTPRFRTRPLTSEPA